MPETLALSKWELLAEKKKKKRQRDILNLRQKTRKSLFVCLSVWIYVCLSVYLLFFDNIADVVSSYLIGLKKRKHLQTKQF